MSCYLQEPLSLLGSDQHLHNPVMWPLVWALFSSLPSLREGALDLQILYELLAFDMRGARTSVPLDTKALSPK